MAEPFEREKKAGASRNGEKRFVIWPFMLLLLVCIGVLYAAVTRRIDPWLGALPIVVILLLSRIARAQTRAIDHERRRRHRHRRR